MKRPHKILIVDDDASLRRLYEEEFRDDGYDVVVAPSGEEALAAARASEFDAAIVDIRLGRADGIQLMRNLLIQRPNLPVILNSAYTSFRSDFSTWAADRYVVKSSDLRELKEAVRDMIEERRRAARRPPKTA